MRVFTLFSFFRRKLKFFRYIFEWHVSRPRVFTPSSFLEYIFQDTRCATYYSELLGSLPRIFTLFCIFSTLPPHLLCFQGRRGPRRAALDTGGGEEQPPPVPKQAAKQARGQKVPRVARREENRSKRERALMPLIGCRVPSRPAMPWEAWFAGNFPGRSGESPYCGGLPVGSRSRCMICEDDSVVHGYQTVSRRLTPYPYPPPSPRFRQHF